MAILTIAVPVPVAGDGPIAPVSTLVGPKTVTFAGRFTGSYTLLGSHDDANFVPVLLFDADGIEGIEQILEGSFKSVRVRANANAMPLSPVSCEVSAVSVPGQNKFGTVAALAAGASGPTPSIDTGALFPPTGLEVGINFACAGSFAGAIVVEGSPDNTDWNPIGTFSAGQTNVRPLVGISPRLEFSPLRTLDKVRYLRLNVAGQITGATTVTVGGGIPASGGGSGASKITIAEDEGMAYLVPPGGTDLEGILYEWALDFTQLGATITPIFAGILSGRASGTVYFNLYVGSTTPGDTTGGTVVATISIGSGGEAVVSAAGAPFANPGAPCLVQVTGVVPDVNSQALIRGLTIVFG
jgi:hypothetical protein